MSLKLNSGQEMSPLGFGTFTVKDVDVIYRAIKNGYRHLGTATYYANEEIIGEAI